jgi:dolichol kinase
MPPILMAKIDKPRLLIFSFNCVSVFLIILEALRHGSYLPVSFSRWFKSMSNGRERLPETFIVTHIYLLMGCAFGPTCTFILLSGGVYPAEWALWSLAGVIFLGIGDTLAAIGGKNYGMTKWRENSAKTQEGSSYCIIGVGATYYIITQFVDTQHYLVSSL